MECIDDLQGAQIDLLSQFANPWIDHHQSRRQHPSSVPQIDAAIISCRLEEEKVPPSHARCSGLCRVSDEHPTGRILLLLHNGSDSEG
jgi:hypothetical protein